MKSDQLALLKQRNVLITVGVLIVVAIIWWLAFMQPEASKLSSVEAHETSLRNEQAQLSDQLIALEAEKRQVLASGTFLTRFGLAVPSLPDQGLLVVQLDHLALAEGVTITLIGDNTIDPPAAGTRYSTLPINMTISGPYVRVRNFVSGLYRLPRLLTIQQLVLSGQGNVNQASMAPFSATIDATAYTTYVPPSTAAAS
jgi:Tfp pilus assembly protein PilO